MKVTRRQIREIIREHQADADAKYLLNEGFLDFMKKLGKSAMAALGKAKDATAEFKKSMDAEFEDLSPELKKGLEKIADGYRADTNEARQALLKKVMSDMDSNLPDSIEKATKQKYAVIVLNYAWSAAGSDGG